MDLLAVTGTVERAGRVTQMTNPRQKDAFEYGSAFSRGAWIREPDATQLQVSGTAAIDERGKSLFPGDCRAQIFRTFENIEALIAQAGASLADICQATVFLKRAQDLPVYAQAAAERGLAGLPAVCVVADICRDDLLFEADATAGFKRHRHGGIRAAATPSARHRFHEFAQRPLFAPQYLMTAIFVIEY